MNFDLVEIENKYPTLGPLECQAILDATHEIMVGYLCREYRYGSYTDELTNINTNGIAFLNAYPVETSSPIFINGATFQGTVNDQMGEIYLEGEGVNRKKILIDYSAGYQVIPADLALALWSIADSLALSASQAGMGSTQSLDSITVPDVGTIRFSSQDFPAPGTTGSSQFGPLFEFILNKYRRVIC